MPARTYDDIAPHYDNMMRPLDRWFLARLRETTFRYLPEDARILEIGAGTGRNFVYYPTNALSIASEPEAMIRVCLLLMMVLSVATICHGQNPRVEAAKLETTYDSDKDRTTIRLAPFQISGESAKYHSLHMAPSFSFAGRQPQRPSIIDFELQTIVKARLLDSDLYVVFMVDGEKIHLSSNRSAVFRPVPGRRWIGERLVFRMPYETFVKITKAKKLDIKFDGVKFEVGSVQLDALRLLASKMN